MALQMRLSLASVGGVFGTACGVVGALRGAGTHCSRGRRVFGFVGCPKVFLWFLCPGRSRTAARPVRGAAEACVSRALAASALSFAIFALTLALALGCALPLDLDLNWSQQLRRRREPLKLKRCRALSSAHDNHLFATEQHGTKTMARVLLLLAGAATALMPAPARQHKRSVMRMGWGDPPVCEPRPRSGFCARCTPSTQRV